MVLEDKLAETAPKKPLALTLGAAAVTLAVIIGVLAGPSVVTCFNSPEGMGVCLRGEMTNAGILPRPAAVAEAEAPEPATEQVAVVEPEVAVGEPALDVTPAPEVPDDLIAATFGLLRAEPDGSVVIAGSGTPGTEIEVYSGESLLGKATVESSGDWVLVPDAPIPPGGTEITLAEAGKTGRAAQSFVVVINDDKSSEPLVVASTPGSISEVLQGLDRPGSETPTQLAAADPVVPTPAPATPTTAPAAEPAPAAVAPASSTVAPTPAEPPAPDGTADPATPAEPAVPAPAPTATPAAPAVEPVPVDPAPESPEPAASTESAPADPAPATPPAAEPAPVEPAVVAPTPAPEVVPEEPAMAVAAADPVAPVAAPAAPAPVIAAVPPTIDAIEIEGDRTFFAGAGPEGATMRLYVDDTFIADATVTEGRWLVEAGKVLTKPEQRVRIDLLQSGSAEVAARAEVDFVVDLPVGDAPIAVAEAPALTAPSEPVAATPAPAEPAVVAPAEPVAEAVESASAVATAEPAPAAAPAEPTPAAEPAPADAPVTAPTAEPAAVTAVAAPPEASPAQAPVAVAEPTPTPAAEPAVPTLVAVAVGGPDAVRFASGKAIIRRGDNLWTIARRVYGEGIKYTTIYDANTGQIRDPDRIYPGQVFELPN